jgi:hypothetical protein
MWFLNLIILIASFEAFKAINPGNFKGGLFSFNRMDAGVYEVDVGNFSAKGDILMAFGHLNSDKRHFVSIYL